MRTSKTFHIDDPAPFREKLLAWAESRYDVLCCLDSHAYSPDNARFNCLVAAGARSQVAPASNALKALDIFYRNTKDWLFGFLSYDLKNEIERLRSENPDGVGLPLLHFFQPELVMELSGDLLKVHYLEGNENLVKDLVVQVNACSGPSAYRGDLTLRSRLGKSEYERTVHLIREHIGRGNIYEMNYCQEFFAGDAVINPLAAYVRLNEVSPTPFSCFYKLGDRFLISASPERFLKRERNKLISQPIKGTIKRGGSPEEDEILKDKLRNDGKERAENIMIVDLVRNDLSRIAVPGSVSVEELCGIYSFRQVHQMISTVSCLVEEGSNLIDILKATFPMGSMTGAPKVRAMELIEELEVTRRGLYSGSVGYIDPERNFDFNVVIRSVLYNRLGKYVSFMVGSAITYHSVPEKEYEECLLKAKAMIEALQARSYPILK